MRHQSQPSFVSDIPALRALSGSITMPGTSVGGVSDKLNFWNKLCYWEIMIYSRAVQIPKDKQAGRHQGTSLTVCLVHTQKKHGDWRGVTPAVSSGAWSLAAGLYHCTFGHCDPTDKVSDFNMLTNYPFTFHLPLGLQIHALPSACHSTIA